VDNSNEAGNQDTIYGWSGVALWLALMLFYPLVAILSRIAGLEGEPNRKLTIRLAILSFLGWLGVVPWLILILLFYPLVAILSRIAGLEGEPNPEVAIRIAILSFIVWVTVVSLVIMF